jgi:hypothetical protein
MATAKISELILPTLPLSGDELFEATQGANSVKVSLHEISSTLYSDSTATLPVVAGVDTGIRSLLSTLEIQDNSLNNAIVVNDGGSVTLGFGGSERLTTDETGVTIVGTITANHLVVDEETVTLGTAQIKSTNGSIDLLHDGITVLETTEDGITLYNTDTTAGDPFISFDSGLGVQGKIGILDGDMYLMNGSVSANKDLFILNYTGSAWDNMIVARGGGGVELYYDDDIVLEARANAFRAYEGGTGEILVDAATAGTLSIYDPNDGDPEIQFHNVTAMQAAVGVVDDDFYIRNGSQASNKDIYLSNYTGASWENMVVGRGGGNVELYTDGNLTFETRPAAFRAYEGGTGEILLDAATPGTLKIYDPTSDAPALELYNSIDVQASVEVISHDLYIRGGAQNHERDIYLQNNNGSSWENMIVARGGGGVTLYDDGIEILAVDSTSVAITGDLTADSATLGSLDTNELTSANIVYVNTSNASEVLPGWGTGTITLDPATTYLGGMEPTAIVVTDNIVFSSGSVLRTLRLTTFGNLSTAGDNSIDIIDCIITYVGSGALFDSSVIGGFSLISQSEIYVVGGGSSVFDLDGSAGTDTVFRLSHTIVVCGMGPTMGIAALGTISSVLLIMETGKILYFTTGLKMNNLTQLSVTSWQTVGSNSSTTHMHFGGTAQGDLHLISLSMTLQPNEYGFNFDSTTAFTDSVTSLGVALSGVTDNAFYPGSYDNTTVGFKFIGNTYIPDSGASAYVNALDQASVQTALDQDVIQRINATFTEVSAERFTTTSDGSIQYIGNEEENMSVMATISGTVSAGTGIGVSFYIAKNNTGNTIVSFADAGGGQVLVTSSVEHGFSDGDRIIIEDTANYDSEYTISDATSTTYLITATWVSTETGSHYQVQEYSKASNEFSGLVSNTSLLSLVSVDTDDILFLCVENTSSTAEWETSNIQLVITKT